MKKLSQEDYMKQSTEAAEAYINLFDEMDQICQDMRDKLSELGDTFSKKFNEIYNKYETISNSDCEDQEWFLDISDEDAKTLYNEAADIYEYMKGINDILDMWDDLDTKVIL